MVTFGLCLRALLWSNMGFKPYSQIDRPMVAVCIAMPIFATVNLALNVLRAVESVGASGISEQFTNLGSATETVKFICVNVQTLIADAMLVIKFLFILSDLRLIHPFSKTYRCWVIYSKSWAIALIPGMLWLGVPGGRNFKHHCLAFNPLRVPHRCKEPPTYRDIVLVNQYSPEHHCHRFVTSSCWRNFKGSIVSIQCLLWLAFMGSIAQTRIFRLLPAHISFEALH